MDSRTKSFRWTLWTLDGQPHLEPPGGTDDLVGDGIFAQVRENGLSINRKSFY